MKEVNLDKYTFIYPGNTEAIRDLNKNKIIFLEETVHDWFLIVKIVNGNLILETTTLVSIFEYDQNKYKITYKSNE
ncbi:hypothetical protein WR164_14490 [Philodulcilactobacillus myokoensis]|uniref:Uncharacterized protein n=1 Tax=Philodulcilactobacillus myokoensis TaxID=2929573 RepID=A0A9W6B224_9LACO|nr:hypothetical protein [Philodulcilactobacillus myokoensis]GLB47470.1 hypothetical protein WR164_14490 [Philodulcilactobacillus myokoensis]